MFKFKSIFVGSVIVMSTLTAFADTAEKASSDKAPGSGPNPYTDCGIGAALFSNTGWAAVTSNVIWDLGLTALTSATASPQTCQGKKVVAALFIRDTYEQLAEQTAQGQGEYLSTVMNIMECKPESQSEAIAATRESMGNLVASPDYAEMSRIEKAAQFYGVVDAAVAAHCKL